MSNLIWNETKGTQGSQFVHYWWDESNTFEIWRDAFGYQVSQFDAEADAFQTIDFVHHKDLDEAKEFCENLTKEISNG